MGVLSLAFGGFGTDTVDLKPATVVASVEDSGQLGTALLDAIGSLEIMGVTVKRVPADDVSRETVTAEQIWASSCLTASAEP